MIRRKKIHNTQFLRQRSVLNYIADFMCKELLLILEVDGSIHLLEENIARDKKREDDLKAIGFTILRFPNWMVLERPGDVVMDIIEWIKIHK